MLNGASPFWVGLPVEPATFRKKLSRLKLQALGKKLSCCSRENPNSRVPEGVPPSELDQISQRDFTTLSGTCPSNEHYSSLFCSGEMGGHPLSSTPWAPRRGGVILDLLPRWYLASCSAKSWSPVASSGARGPQWKLSPQSPQSPQTFSQQPLIYQGTLRASQPLQSRPRLQLQMSPPSRSQEAATATAVIVPTTAADGSRKARTLRISGFHRRDLLLGLFG